MDKVQNGGYFFILKFQIFFGVLENPDIFGVNGRCWAQAFIYIYTRYSNINNIQ